MCDSRKGSSVPYGTRRHHGTFSSPAPHPAARTRSNTPVRLPARIGGRLFGVGSCFAGQMNRGELGLDRGEWRQTGPLLLSSLREKELQGHGAHQVRALGMFIVVF